MSRHLPDLRKGFYMKRVLMTVLALAIVFGLAACGKKSEPASDAITGEQALAAVKKYCMSENPNLEAMVNSGEYTIEWKVESENEKQIVVLYRSYTAAQVRYYIDPVSGYTYITEFMPGITEEEETKDETFNIKDYMD